MKALLGLPFALIGLVLQSIRLALGQIWVNKVRAVLTTLGIVIGVASVTAVVAALCGLNAKIMSEVETFGPNRLFIWVRWPDTGPKKNASWTTIRFMPEQLEGLLEHCPSVAAFTRIIGSRRTVRYGERTLDGVRVTAIDASWHDIESRPVIVGRPFSFLDESQGRFVCIIDPTLRDKLRLDKDPVGEFITIEPYTYRIVGVVDVRPSFTFIQAGLSGDAYEVFVPFKNIYDTREERGFGFIYAAGKSPAVSQEAQAELKFFLRQRRQLKADEPDTFEVLAVENEVRTFNRIATRFTLVTMGIVAISLVVGGVGIMNIMLVSVSERTREIGLRKSVGATNLAILAQFLIEALVLCCLGGLFGLLLGQGLTRIIANIPGVNLERAYIPGWAVAMSFGFSAAVGVAFGMFPAIKAARLDPIDALRHE